MGSAAISQSLRAAIGSIRGPFVPVLKSALAATTGDAVVGRVRGPLVATEAGIGRCIGAEHAGLARAAAAKNL